VAAVLQRGFALETVTAAARGTRRTVAVSGERDGADVGSEERERSMLVGFTCARGLYGVKTRYRGRAALAERCGESIEVQRLTCGVPAP
jgi:hypothetical protein